LRKLQENFHKPIHPPLGNRTSIIRWPQWNGSYPQEDKGERAKALMEKRSRGSLARSDIEAEAQLQEKERRKAMKGNKTSRKQNTEKNRALPVSISTSKTGNEAGQLRGSSIASVGMPIVRPIQNRKPSKSLSSMNRIEHDLWHSRNDANLGNQRPSHNFSNINGAVQ
ncbi:hypothetical protein ACJRO7_026454, partial [Eucalyptus globulus]